jgi:hypothetical protein
MTVYSYFDRVELLELVSIYPLFCKGLSCHGLSTRSRDMADLALEVNSNLQLCSL